jgi:predicted DCC family thiol-disulfide oxidoreductase YuxK
MGNCKHAGAHAYNRGSMVYPVSSLTENRSDVSIVLFDGHCNWCNRSVQWIIRHDPEGVLHFAPLQSGTGRRLLQKHGLPVDFMDSLVFIENGTASTHSTASLRIARRLGGVYRLAAVLLVVPRPIRDWVYRILARNRYRFAGRSESCMVPDESIRRRFLDWD